MKTGTKILIGTGIFTAMVALFVGGYLFHQYRQFAQNLFLDHSTLNGLDVSCMSVDDAYETVYLDSKNKVLTLTADNVEIARLELSDFCEITFDREAIQKGMDEITFQDFLKGKSREYEAEGTAVMDRKQAAFCLKKALAAVPQTKAVNATIKKTEYSFALMEEKPGTVIRRKKLLDRIEERLDQIVKNEITSMDVSEFYKEPKVKAEALEKDLEKLEAYLDWSVTYTDCDVNIDGYDLFPYISYDNKKTEIVIDDSFLKEKVSELAGKLDTVGSVRKFRTTSYAKKSKKAHSGRVIEVEGGTYGWSVNTQAEYEKLSQLLKKRKSKEGREPVWYREARGTHEDDIGDTYIEISIDRQHLWYYVDGKLSMETDIVTGMKGRSDTPPGTYYITERINGKYLVGDDYKTWVNKWMRLTNMGIGLHDATWKSRFGGNIYTYSGSHGCINLPYEFACDLFDAVFTGLPVIIYDNQ